MRRVVLSLAALAIAWAAPASAENVGHHHVDWPGETLTVVDLAPDGDVWFVVRPQGPDPDKVLRLDPATGDTSTFTEDGLSVVDLTVGDDGTVWLATMGDIASLDPDTGTFEWHAYRTVDTWRSASRAVTTGADGTVWFLDASIGGVGRIDPDTGATEFAVDGDLGIAARPEVVEAGDGTVWYGAPESYGGIRRFDPDTGTFSTLTDPDERLAMAFSLAVDDGGDVWFTDPYRAAIGRIDVESSTVAASFTNDAIAAVVDDEASYVRPADDGTLWFLSLTGIGRMDRATGLARSQPRLLEGTEEDRVPMPEDAVIDPAGGLWVISMENLVHHVPTCDGRPVTVDHALGQAATDGDDVILGTDRNDTVGGLSGDDVICGGLGDDQLRGGPGRDRIFGAGGADDLRADAGGGLVVGGPGQDAVVGGSGADDLRGGPGNDALAGRLGRDRIDGGTGTNTCNGGPGRDVLLRCLTGDLG